MTEELESQLVSDIEIIKNSLKSGLPKDPNEPFTVHQAAEEYPISAYSLRQLCKQRKIIHYRGDGATSTIYLKRQNLEDYFYAEHKKQLVNNHLKPL